MTDIVSPLPGTFYRAPGPGKPPFTEPGQSIEAGKPVGIIEIMKQFTEITAPAAGTVGEFRVEDNGTVNPGDIIVSIEDSDA